MQLTKQQQELTGAYVKKELTGKALTDFETDLARNSALQEEVIFQKSIFSALKLNRMEQAVQQVKADNMTDDKKQHPKYKVIQSNMRQARIENTNRQRRIRYWASGLVAAACIALVGIFGLRMYLNNQLDSDIAEQAAMMERVRIPVTKGEIKEVSARRAVIEEKLEQAEQAFKEDDWETTLSIFEQLRKQYKYNSAEMDFCESIIFHYKKEYKKSVEKLESINLEEVESACEMQYFLTLSYLKVKNKTKAKYQYETLVESPQKCDKHAIENLNKYFTL